MSRADTKNVSSVPHSSQMLGIITRTFHGFDQGKKSVCVIDEVEVDTIRKDNLSLYHYNVFLVLGYCYVIFRTTVSNTMLINLSIIIHLNCSAFNKTWHLMELWQVFCCKLLGIL